MQATSLRCEDGLNPKVLDLLPMQLPEKGHITVNLKILSYSYKIQVFGRHTTIVELQSTISSYELNRKYLNKFLMLIKLMQYAQLF